MDLRDANSQYAFEEEPYPSRSRRAREVSEEFLMNDTLSGGVPKNQSQSNPQVAETSESDSDHEETTPGLVTQNSTPEPPAERSGPGIRQFGTKKTVDVGSFYKLRATLEDSQHLKKLGCMSQRKNVPRNHRSGEAHLIPFQDSIEKIFGVTKDNISSNLILFEYCTKFIF
jgi:hypothetical protein